MEVTVQIPDGKLCEGCIFMITPAQWAARCKRFGNKDLKWNPYLEQKGGRNIYHNGITKCDECLEESVR